MTDTEWRAVPGHEGFYEVSSTGLVRSLDRTIHYTSRWGTPASRFAPGIVLQPVRRPAGHLVVDLAGTDWYVHHAVLEAFVGPRPAGMECLRHNGDPADNAVTNLRWGTRGDNSRDAVRHGTHGMARREMCPRRHDLRAPNLVRSKLPTRQCLACARAKRSAAYHGYSAEWIQRDSDRRFREIMAGEVGTGVGSGWPAAGTTVTPPVAPPRPGPSHDSACATPASGR